MQPDSWRLQIRMQTPGRALRIEISSQALTPEQARACFGLLFADATVAAEPALKGHTDHSAVDPPRVISSEPSIRRVRRRRVGVGGTAGTGSTAHDHHFG